MNNQIVNHSLKRMMSGFCSTALIACFVLGGSNAFAQTAYRVTDLELLPSKEESVPAAINGRGLVPGTSSAKASREAAFRYNPNNPAPMEDIGLSTRGLVSRGFGINNIGAVVGDSAVIATSTTDSPIRRAALFRNGSVIDLGTSWSVVADTDLHDVIVFFSRNENLTAMPIVFYGIRGFSAL